MKHGTQYVRCERQLYSQAGLSGGDDTKDVAGVFRRDCLSCLKACAGYGYLL
jgi:hypothetical protein